MQEKITFFIKIKIEIVIVLLCFMLSGAIFFYFFFGAELISNIAVWLLRLC